jgi:ribosomal protein L32
MSAYINCPKCDNDTLDVDTLCCDCGYGRETPKQPAPVAAQDAPLQKCPACGRTDVPLRACFECGHFWHEPTAQDVMGVLEDDGLAAITADSCRNFGDTRLVVDIYRAAVREKLKEKLKEKQ